VFALVNLAYSASASSSRSCIGVYQLVLATKPAQEEAIPIVVLVATGLESCSRWCTVWNTHWAKLVQFGPQGVNRHFQEACSPRGSWHMGSWRMVTRAARVIHLFEHVCWEGGRRRTALLREKGSAAPARRRAEGPAEGPAAAVAP
jgi:hypothetical protein